MCSVSKVNELLSSFSSNSSSSSSPVPSVSAVKLRHSRDAFHLVDIREADEVTESDPLPADITTDVHVPMGKLLSSSNSVLLEPDNPNKTIVLMCSTGYRSSIAASALSSSNKNSSNNIAVLAHGVVGLHNPAATIPDMLVVLGTKSSPEKLTLALNACAVSAKDTTTVLALMGDGVCTFLRKGSNIEEASPESFRVEETFIGEPFQPTHVLWKQFVATGNGVVLACTSCVKSRKMEFGSDLLDGVQPMQMPDLIRMLGEANKTLQFM